jgi:hypothetical protein
MSAKFDFFGLLLSLALIGLSRLGGAAFTIVRGLSS